MAEKRKLLHLNDLDYELKQKERHQEWDGPACAGGIIKKQCQHQQQKLHGSKELIK